MPAALRRCVAEVDATVVVLSYNDESWVGLEELRETCSVRGEVAVLTLAAGAGSRWTQGAGVVKAVTRSPPVTPIPICSSSPLGSLPSVSVVNEMTAGMPTS